MQSFADNVIPLLPDPAATTEAPPIAMTPVLSADAHVSTFATGRDVVDNCTLVPAVVTVVLPLPMVSYPPASVVVVGIFLPSLVTAKTLPQRINPINNIPVIFIFSLLPEEPAVLKF